MFKKFNTTFTLFLCSIALVSAVSAAPKLQISPGVKTMQTNETFSFQVVLDAGTQNIQTADIYVQYDPLFLDYVGFTKGSAFTADPFVQTFPDKVYIAAFSTSQSTSVTGTATIGTIQFKAKQVGTTNLRYMCDTSKVETSKIILTAQAQGTNVIDCINTTGAVITIVAATGPTGTPVSNTNTTVTTSGAATNASYQQLPQTGLGAPTAPPQVVYETVTQLPQAGIFDGVLMFGLPGGVLIIAAGYLRRFHG